LFRITHFNSLWYFLGEIYKRKLILGKMLNTILKIKDFTPCSIFVDGPKFGIQTFLFTSLTDL